MIKILFKAWKKAYNEINADKILAKKYIKFLKKEYKRIYKYYEDLSEIENILFEDYWIFPSRFESKSDAYSRFLAFMRYGEYDKEDAGLNGFVYVFKELVKDMNDICIDASRAYKNDDYEYVKTMYDSYLELL